MSNVLVTSIGSASAESVLHSLKTHGNYVVGTNIYEEAHTYCSGLVDRFYKVSRSDNPKFVSELVNICETERIEFVILLTDVEIDALNKNREIFINKGIIICFADYDCISVCRNKRSSSELVRKFGICKVPDELSSITESTKFPVICKRIDGRSSQGMCILHSFEEYNEVKEKYLNDKNYIFQNFVEGNVVTVDLLRFGETIVSISREEFVRTPNGLGISVQTFYNEVLESIVRKIAEALNIFGCVNFEFIRTSENCFYFLECNPRFSGGVNFSILSGYDFVINHLNCFSGKKVSNNVSLVEQVINRKYTDLIYSKGDKNAQD